MLEISLNCDSNSNTCKSVFNESHQIYYIHGHPSSYNKDVGNRYLAASQDMFPFIAKAVQWDGMDLTLAS